MLEKLKGLRQEGDADAVKAKAEKAIETLEAFIDEEDRRRPKLLSETMTAQEEGELVMEMINRLGLDGHHFFTASIYAMSPASVAYLLEL